MKKSTLFFKVMVLLALLVPWTSWGQIALIAGDDVIWGHGPTIYINDEGQISSDGETYSDDITINFDDVQDRNEGNWEFGEEIEPTDLPITVTPSEDGEQVTLAVKEDTKVSDITAVKFHIAALNNGGQRKGWIEFGLIAGKTNISDEESITISINGGSDSKIYNGEAISISVTTTDGTSLVMGTDYQVYIDDNTTAITTEAGLPKNVKEGDTEAAYSIVIEGIGDDYYGKTVATAVTIKKRPITVTVDDSKTLEFELGTANPSFTASEYLVAKGIEGKTESGLVTKDGKEETPNFTGNLTFDASSITGTGNQTVSLTYEESNIQDNTAGTGFKKDNYDITLSLDNVSVTVKPIEIDAEDVTTYEGEDNASKEVTANGYSVVYDGQKHGIGSVYVNSQKVEGFQVSYTDSDGNPLGENNEPVNVTGEEDEYTATITFAEDSKYELVGELTRSITITRRLLNIVQDSEVTALKWNGTEPVLTADTYLNIEEKKAESGPIEEGITISGDLTKTDSETDGKVVLTKGNASINYAGATANNYKENWNVVSAENEQGGLVIDEGDDAPSTVTEDEITIAQEGEGGNTITLTNGGKNSEVYNGLVYNVTKIGDVEIPEGVTPTFTYTNSEGNSEEATEIKNAGKYEISVSFETTGEGGGVVTHEATQTFTIDQRPLTIAVKDVDIEVTSLTNETVNSAFTAKIEGQQFSEQIEIQNAVPTEQENITFKNGNLTLVPGNAWILGENAAAITTVENIELAEAWKVNYTLGEPTNGTLNVVYLIDETNKEEIFKGILFNNGETRYYDGTPLVEEDITLTIEGNEPSSYTVAFAGEDEELEDAGIYTATITIQDSNYKIAEGTDLRVACTITPRPIVLYFSFGNGDNTIKEGESLVFGKNVFVEVAEESENNKGFADGEEDEFDKLVADGTIKAEFALGDEQPDGTYAIKLVSFTYPVGDVEGTALNYSNYDAQLLTGLVKANGEGGTETELPDAGEAGEDGTIDYPGEGGSEIIVGDVDIIDEETGIGGSGINYRQYELKFCETDFFPNLNDYEVEGLKLFSRHNRFYTKANGSFTIWYEKDGVKNGEYGDYRIYISRNGADGDYSELKLDEVSDYFQIRNVNSDIWVRIYYGTGFPVANEEITATDVRAYAQANKIVVITPEPTDVQIISMAGAVVATDQVTGQREFANLAEGVYIVRMGETVIKLQVRN